MKRYSAMRAFLLGGIAATSIGFVAAQKSHDNTVNHNLTIVTQIISELEEGYVDTLNNDEMMHNAIDAMLATLDPYTNYFTDSEQEAFESSSKGEFGGIGVYMTQYNGNVYLTSPTKGGPADMAGIRSGDRVVRVDTIDTKGFPSNKVSKLLRGEPGTKVNVGIVRPYVADSLLSFDITRAKINMPAVELARVDDNGIGYISLTTFSEKAAQEVRQALIEFKQNPKLKGIIFDLANNGGGLLSQAVEIAGMFVERGTTIATTRGRDSVELRNYRTTKTPIFPDIPLVVLINSGSASASEILAGALQDLDRAVLVGERSFGKGLVQTTQQLPFGHMLKYTTAKYYIPSGRLIQALDYSHRNADGSARYVPDSLTSIFHTRNGREVRDGGGLMPDIEVKDTIVSNLVYELAKGRILYDYANEYAATHESIDPPQKFKLSEEDFELLKQRLKEAKFTYNNESAALLTQLREKAKEEGFVTDSVDSTLNYLSDALKPDIDKDLAKQHYEIESILVPWIVDRFYYDEGRAEAALRWNDNYHKALEIINDKNEYNKILKKKK
jgi:carboxyl-terminal processing protease